MNLVLADNYFITQNCSDLYTVYLVNVANLRNVYHHSQNQQMIWSHFQVQLASWTTELNFMTVCPSHNSIS